MKEYKDTDANAAPPQDEPRRTRGLLLMRSGGQAFAVFADETDGVAERLRPAPLPHAPRAVLGIVCIRGRMYTLLNLPALLGPQGGNGAAPEDEHEREAERELKCEVECEAGYEAERAVECEIERAVEREVMPRFAVALRGDEQLALAADHVEGTLEVAAGALETPDHSSHALRATLESGGARVLVLDPTRLFDAATQGFERRRQRQ
jgi:chemotaxis signal transduction protein